MASPRIWESLPLLLVLVETYFRWTAAQTVTVSDRNVIAIRGIDGHDFTKFCSVTGVSVSAIQEIQWLKGNEIVKTDNTDPLDESHLFISNEHMTADTAGQYYCRAMITGDLTESSSAGRLTLLENQVIVAPTPQYAVLGSSIELQCTIVADGLAIRDTWAVEDSDFDTGLNILSPVDIAQEGMYRCRLIDVNEEMEDVERVVEFRVTVPPLIIMKPLSHYFFTEDTFQRSISISYSGRQGDTSAVVWMRDGETLATSGEGYEIQETYNATDLITTTSIVFIGLNLSRSFEGQYSVVITNDNDVIPVAERTASTSFSISFSGPQSSLSQPSGSTEQYNVVTTQNMLHFPERKPMTNVTIITQTDSTQLIVLFGTIVPLNIVILIVVILIVLVISKKKRKGDDRRDEGDNNIGPEPIPVYEGTQPIEMQQNELYEVSKPVACQQSCAYDFRE